jgi:hypothetical protein
MRSARKTTAEVESNFPAGIMKRALTNRKNYAPAASMLRSKAVAEGGHTPFALLTLFASADVRAALVGGFPRQLLLDDSNRRANLRCCR